MSNFARWPRWAARLLLATLAVLVVVATVPGSVSPQPARAAAEHRSDVGLYRAIVNRVAQGEDYYAAAAAEQRANGYPTAPAVAFREPAETLLLVALQTDLARHAALLGVAIAATAALWFALGRMDLTPATRRWALLLTLTGMAVCLAQNAPYMHETWAGLLITLSLALRRPERWALSVCVALAACLVRELALPFLFVMLAFAAHERRWRESLAWLGAIAVFGGVFAIHCGLAGAQHRVGDLSSGGWLKFNGLSFVVATLRWNAVLALAPGWMLIAVASVSAVGLAGCRSGLASRGALTLIGYIIAFAVVGRPDNQYWGILYAPLVPLGLALAPRALKELAVRALTKAPLPDRSAVSQPSTA
jgi:hypothetical protein